MSGAQVHFQRRLEMNDVFHHLARQPGGIRQFSFRNLQEEFVVKLQHHFPGQTPVGQGWVQLHHGLLDDVRGGALKGGVDGAALRLLA